jgi:hypothetical protein
MIRHKDIGIEGHAVALTIPFEAIQICLVIRVLVKEHRPVVAPGRDQ